MKVQKILTLIVASIITAILISGCSLLDSPDNSGSETQTGDSRSSYEKNESSYSASNSQSGSTGDNGGSQSDSQSSSVDGVNIVAEFSDGALYWNDVNAAVYEIVIDGVSVDTATEPQYSLEQYSHGIYNAEVRAYMSLGDGSYVSAFVTCVIRAKMTDVTAQDKTLYWQAVNGATEYYIYKEDAFIAQTSGNSYTVEADGTYSVAAVFEDQRLNSDKSKPVTVGNVVLTAPTLTIDGSILRWTEVPGAQIYFVCMGDVKIAAIFTNRLDIGNIYATKYQEDYPNGITVYVYAATDDSDGPHSNTVTYKG